MVAPISEHGTSVFSRPRILVGLACHNPRRSSKVAGGIRTRIARRMPSGVLPIKRTRLKTGSGRTPPTLRHQAYEDRRLST